MALEFLRKWKIWFIDALISLAADLKKADIDLKIRMVGFDIAYTRTKKELSCIAQDTRVSMSIRALWSGSLQ